MIEDYPVKQRDYERSLLQLKQRFSLALKNLGIVAFDCKHIMHVTISYRLELNSHYR